MPIALEVKNELWGVDLDENVNVTVTHINVKMHLPEGVQQPELRTSCFNFVQLCNCYQYKLLFILTLQSPAGVSMSQVC